jgi:hypothetical protein
MSEKKDFMVKKAQKGKVILTIILLIFAQGLLNVYL